VAARKGVSAIDLHVRRLRGLARTIQPMCARGGGGGGGQVCFVFVFFFFFLFISLVSVQMQGRMCNVCMYVRSCTRSGAEWRTTDSPLVAGAWRGWTGIRFPFPVLRADTYVE